MWYLVILSILKSFALRTYPQQYCMLKGRSNIISGMRQLKFTKPCKFKAITVEELKKKREQFILLIKHKHHSVQPHSINKHQSQKTLNSTLLTCKVFTCTLDTLLAKLYIHTSVPHLTVTAMKERVMTMQSYTSVQLLCILKRIKYYTIGDETTMQNPDVLPDTLFKSSFCPEYMRRHNKDRRTHKRTKKNTTFLHQKTNF